MDDLISDETRWKVSTDASDALMSLDDKKVVRVLRGASKDIQPPEMARNLPYLCKPGLPMLANG